MPFEDCISEACECYLNAFLCFLKCEGLEKAKDCHRKYCWLLNPFQEGWYGKFTEELLASFEYLDPENFMSIVLLY